ncbi:MAG: APC family permease [Emcibacter sp.]|nr:APC family permease [Emcibacter sp.]
MSTGLNGKQGIGLWGVIFTITGFIIGVSAFILPGQLVEMAGPAVTVSYLIAGLVALLSCVVTAQIGVVLPSDGGSFVAISKLVSPFFGFLIIWVLLIAAVVANAFMAYGFADYFYNFIPTFDKTFVAITVVLFFGILNVISPNIVVRVQAALVIIFLLALMLFLVGSLPHFDMQKMQPFVPNGYGAVLLAATTAYFSFGGFVLLLELGGEIERPSRNIPIGLAVTFLIVLSVYLAVSLAIAGTSLFIPEGEVAILSIARQIMPSWVLNIFVLAILAAAATSINSLILAYSRDIMVVALSGFLPKAIGEMSGSSHTPRKAILLLMLLSCIAILSGNRVEELAIVAVMGIMLQQIFLAICVWRIPQRMPIQYEKSAFKIPVWLIRFVAIALIIVSSAFIIVTIIEKLSLVLLLVGLISLGVVYFFAVSVWMKRKGVDVLSRFEEQIEKLTQIKTERL